MITGITQFGLEGRVATVDHDPAIVSTDVPAGSIILSTSTGLLYRKLTGGSNTDVLPMTASSQPFDWDSGASAVAAVVAAGMLSLELLADTDSKVVGGDVAPLHVDLDQALELDVKIVTLSLGDASADAHLRLTARYVGLGEAADKTPDETIDHIFEVANVDKCVHAVTFTLDPSLISPEDLLNLELSRLGTSASDVFTGSIGVAERSLLRFFN